MSNCASVAAKAVLGRRGLISSKRLSKMLRVLASTAELLDAGTVEAYVRRRGLTRAHTLEVTRLGGGVSNVVFAVAGSDIRAVVKQARPKLDVAEEWLAGQDRALTEADALRVARVILGPAVPAVLDVDTASFAITIERGSSLSIDWKSELLSGSIEPARALELGRLLRNFHQSTGLLEELAERFGQEVFRQLRLDPYYETSAIRNPTLSKAIRRLENELSHGQCLVHGDFSPKNVLVGGDGGLMIIDFEVAHWGNPVFDVAFMLSHLVLKSIHMPARASALLQCARAFGEAYEVVDSSIYAQVGALLIARIDGKSPVEYLDHAGRQTTRELGTALLLEPVRSVAGLWERLSALP